MLLISFIISFFNKIINQAQNCKNHLWKDLMPEKIHLPQLRILKLEMTYCD